MEINAKMDMSRSSTVVVMSEGGQSWVRVEQNKKWTPVRSENLMEVIRKLQ